MDAIFVFFIIYIKVTDILCYKLELRIVRIKMRKGDINEGKRVARKGKETLKRNKLCHALTLTPQDERKLHVLQTRTNKMKYK